MCPVQPSRGIICCMRAPPSTLLVLAFSFAVAAPAASQAPADDPDARTLMAAVITRRAAMLAALPPCRYDAYVKTAAFDLGAPSDSATSVLLLDRKSTRLNSSH